MLVIDDSDATREVYVESLRLDGFTVEEAIDGEQGLAKAVRSIPDVIITDLEMPGRDGWDMIRALRADQRTHNVPIIVCSGRPVTPPSRAKTYDVHLLKPFLPDVLLSHVRELTRQQQAQEA